MPVHFVGEPLLRLLDQLRLPFVADLKDVVDKDVLDQEVLIGKALWPWDP